MTARYEAEIAEIQAVEEKEATAGQLWSQQNQLTENLARVLQGVDRYDLSRTAKLAYLEVIRNRSNPDIQYDVMKGTDTLEAVLQVPGQFEGFRYGEAITPRPTLKSHRSSLTAIQATSIQTDIFGRR